MEDAQSVIGTALFQSSFEIAVCGVVNKKRKHAKRKARHQDGLFTKAGERSSSELRGHGTLGEFRNPDLSLL